MSRDKTPRELLRECLQRSAEDVASWPAWMVHAASPGRLFTVPSPEPPAEKPDPFEPRGSRLAFDHRYRYGLAELIEACAAAMRNFYLHLLYRDGSR